MESLSTAVKPSVGPSTLEEMGLVDVKVVSSTVGVSKAWIWAAAARGAFPKPVRLSARCTRWRTRDVKAWIEAQGQPEQEAA